MIKIILFTILFFTTPLLVTAQFVINEIAWMGTPVECVDTKQYLRYEWVDLYNSTNESISVNGWILQAADFQIPLEGTIPAQEYFLVGASSKIPNVDVNYAILAGKFANAGQKILLKDATGVIIDEVDARGGWQAGDNTEKLTMEKRMSGEWASSLRVGGTPRATNTEAIQKSAEEELPITQRSQNVFNVLPLLLSLLLSLVGAVGVLLLARHLLKQNPESEV